LWIATACSPRERGAAIELDGLNGQRLEPGKETERADVAGHAWRTEHSDALGPAVREREEQARKPSDRRRRERREQHGVEAAVQLEPVLSAEPLEPFRCVD
jgi:hypothetical protein